MKILKKALRLLLTVTGLFLLWQILIRVARKKFHFPAPAFIGRFLDSDLRRKFQPADQIIRRSGIKPGMTVLEIGCGSGAYTTAIAKAVGNQGKVYALDIQPDMLLLLQQKLALPENIKITNVELVNRSAYDLPFANDSIDLVYMITVLQEIPDKQRTLKEVKRVLKPGGLLAVSEWLVDPDYPLPTTTAMDGQKAGLKLHRLEGSLWTYTIVFRKD
ncbi:MAG TPA: class I SAM-dependent methyltransferase [Anaerolineaceae bacterium]